MQKLVIDAYYAEAEEGLFTATAEVDTSRRVVVYGDSLKATKANLREALQASLTDDEVIRVVDHVADQSTVDEVAP